MDNDLIQVVKKLSPEEKKALKRLKDREYARLSMRKRYEQHHEEELEKAKQRRIKKAQEQGRELQAKPGRPRKQCIYIITSPSEL